LGLPGIDGFEVCRQIKRDPQLRLRRVVALTAFSQDEYRARAKEVGCELYLVKPVDAKVLEVLLG
jgi:CheY-like chemotaxis protein